MKHSLVLLGLSSVFLSLFYLSHWVLTEVGLGKKEIGSDIQTMLQLKKKNLIGLFVKLNPGKKRDWVGVEWVGLNYFYGGSLDIYPRFCLDLT